LRVSDAIGYGKWTAILLDATWRGLDPQEVYARTQVGGNPRILSAIKYHKVLTNEAIPLSEDIVTYDQLHLETWEPTPTEIINKCSLIQDVPAKPWLTASQVEQAVQEAGRCFSCGRCNECDTCWIYCPEGVISRSNGEYTIDYDYCKGCMLCAAVCPRRAIAITEEKK
jgi:2-oxoacid:acceptor oxidoreductase delta subunit (pyruvate/2-ketoisovalerate family)